MVKNHLKSLGSRHPSSRIQDRLQETSSYQLPTTPSPYIRNVPLSNLARNIIFTVFWSYYPGSSGTRKARILFFSFSCKEAERIEQADNQPETTQRLHRLQQVQDGVGKVCHSHYPQKCCNVHYRPKGRILSRPHSPVFTKVPKVLCPFSRGFHVTFSISCTPLWHIFSPQNLHQGDDRGGGVPKTAGHTDCSISRRPAGYWTKQTEPDFFQKHHNRNFRKTRLDHKLPKIRFITSHSKEIPGSKFKLMLTNVIPSTGKGGSYQGGVKKVPEKVSYLHQGRYEGPRTINSMHPLSGLVPSPYSSSPEMGSKILEQEFEGTGQKGINPRISQGRSQVVADGHKSRQGNLLEEQSVYHHTDRRQQERLGSSASSKVIAGLLDRGDLQKVVQLSRTKGSMGSAQLKHCPIGRTSCVDTVRQHHDSIIPEEARGNQIPITDVLNKANIFVGRGPCPINLGYPSKGNREHQGGFPQPKENTSQRVVHKRGDIPVPILSLGRTSNRLVCDKKKLQVSTLFFLRKRGDKRSSGCILPPLEHHSRLRLPPYSPDRQSIGENLSREDTDHICVPKLAQKELVPNSEADVHSGPSHVTSVRRSPGTGSNIPSRSRKTPVISMDPESDYMKSQGLSSAVINTLKASRKPVTFAIYHKIWKKFCSFCADNPPCQSNPNILQVLNFLQKGLELGLSTSTLKVQVSALSAFFDQPLIEHRWVKRFILAASRLKPQVLKRTSSWDLSLVLNALIKEPFEPISSASVKNLTLKTGFLVAITSARRLGELQAISIKEPYMRVLDDRIILTLDPNFIPKVVSEFHRGQEIILPSFCKNPSSEREREWHTLDGKNKGRKASKATIARWLRMAISSCYDIQEIPVPSGIRAHSTRAVSTSWAEKRGASLEQICKAATWTSSSTFSKHYRLDLPSSKDLSFGRKVLQAVIPP
ncbi:uncharacterized protein [Engystomops pustulosus]|uniref:uncharacterized protein isoform X1 n=1 Tax=Engystomops pustulosus TaxID=76066 RepID=UPI003AFA6204